MALSEVLFLILHLNTLQGTFHKTTENEFSTSRLFLPPFMLCILFVTLIFFFGISWEILRFHILGSLLLQLIIFFFVNFSFSSQWDLFLSIPMHFNSLLVSSYFLFQQCSFSCLVSRVFSLSWLLFFSPLSSAGRGPGSVRTWWR